jgi:tetratricopeptide (TPR) repeat protein
MTPTSHTHADDINLSVVPLEAKRLAEHLRQWCSRHLDADSTSIDHARRLADSLDHWANDHELPHDSSISIAHPSATPTRHRPRAAELPSVASLLGQASPARPATRRALSAPKLAQHSSPPAPTNMPVKLASPRPMIAEDAPIPADPIVPIPSALTPVEVPPKPLRKREFVDFDEPSPPSKPITASARRSNESAAREIRSARDVFQQRPAADRSDLVIPARWWNIPIAITLLVGIAVAMGGIGVEVMRVAHSKAILARALNDPKATGDQIVAIVRGMRSSPLARWDADRELLTARAMLLASERTAGPATSDPSTQRENARVHFRRAADRNPLSPWHRMNVALTASAHLAEGFWDKLAPLESHEPMIAEQSALYQIQAGSRALGIERIGKIIQSQPSSAGRLARSLLAAGASVNELMAVMPDSPDAINGLLTILQTDAVIGLRRAVEERLTQLTLRATNSDGVAWKADDWGTWGEIDIRLERWSEAASKIERAIELDPSQVRYKLLLASIRTEQQNVDEAKRLLAELPVKLSAQEETQRRSILAKLEPTNPTAPRTIRASAN